MRKEIVKIRWVCDNCQKEVIVVTESNDYPEGWGEHQWLQSNCGLYGYTRENWYDLCDECYPKRKEILPDT